MNKYIKYGLLGLGLVALPSCMDTLDTNPTTIFDEETVWGSKATADAFVNATYGDVFNVGWATSGTGIYWEARTPYGVNADQVGGGTDGVAKETLTAWSDYGSSRFSLLRRCNLIIEKAAASTTMSENEKAEMVAKGRLLRGMVFFDQARKMGRFVPLREVLTVESDSLSYSIPLTKNEAESYKYVIEDLEAAIPHLPESAAPGLPTKYAAQVILSRACLQAYAYTKDASYLDKAINATNDVISNSGSKLASNYGNIFDNNSPTDSEILWARYLLETNTQQSSIAELQYAYPNINPNDMVTSLCPIKYASDLYTFESWSTHFPTQDLVDQYLVIDEETGEALPWYETSQWKNNVEELDPTTITEPGQVDSYARATGELRRIPTQQDLQGANAGHPHFLRYAKLKEGSTRDISDLMNQGRDKRFSMSVVHDKNTWVGEYIETNLGGNFSQGVRDKEDGGWYNTITGYYWKKGTLDKLNPRAIWNSKLDYHYIAARLGEAYLNLAEAQLLKGNIPAAVEALNATRTTHGGLTPSKAATEEEAWADYIRERSVEMVNEGSDLYFSFLRWGKYGGAANHGRAAGDIIYDLDRPVYKMSISRDRSQMVVSQVTLLNSASRMFTEKRYLLPIYQGFLDTREAYGLDCIQNPGW